MYHKGFFPEQNSRQYDILNLYSNLIHMSDAPWFKNWNILPVFVQAYINQAEFERIKALARLS